MCGCSKSVAVANTTLMQSQQSSVVEDVNCEVSRTEVEAVKTQLLSIRTPENFVTINNAMGLIDTMLNTGKYCLYKISDFALN